MISTSAGGGFTIPTVTEIASVVNLETGEITRGDLAAVIDSLFPDTPFRRVLPASAARPDVFEEDGGAAAVQHDARSAGLVKSAISDRLRFRVFSDLFEVVGSRSKKVDQVPTSKRGKVTGFSRRSRVRFLRSMAITRNVTEAGRFVTLTVPDSILSSYEDDDDGLRLLAADLKRWQATLVKRLRRDFPALRGWWRVEVEDRKSGEYRGRRVPHFHMLVWGLDVKLSTLRAMLRSDWWEIVGSEDDKHLRAGVQTDVIFNRRHAMAYASKYVAKEARDDDEIGRRWGCFGDLDQTEDMTGALIPGEWVKLRRLIRGWVRGRGRRAWRSLSGDPASGVSVFGLGDLSVDGVVNPTIYRMLQASRT